MDDICNAINWDDDDDDDDDVPSLESFGYNQAALSTFTQAGSHFNGVSSCPVPSPSPATNDHTWAANQVRACKNAVGETSHHVCTVDTKGKKGKSRAYHSTI